MGRLLTYTCDRCKTSWPSSNDDQLWTVQIYSKCDVSSHYGTLNATGCAAEWCRACYETLGFVPQIASKPAVIPELTFEVKLREFIRSVFQEEIPQ